ncbi:MAG TPA: MFS transporter, partial [Novosphingobium sp.]|nr:MFS transporter [Novosphingobium sp.]
MKAGSWPSIILIYLFSVCAGGAIGKIIPLVGVLAQALHVGPDRAAWLISAVLPASVVLAPFGGALSDRLGDRRLTAIGLAVMIAANGAQWLATGYGALLAARLVEGGGFVCLTLGPAAMMMRSTQG